MAETARKSINDEDFFDDANLDELGEDVGSFEPEDALTAGEGDGEEEPGEDGEGEGETPPADDEGSEEWVDPAPHLTDLETAKVAYAEVRKYADKARMDLLKAEEARVQAEAEMAESFDFTPEPVYDPSAFTQLAGQDPRAAFRYALTSGQTADAQAAIARVQTDSAELAAQAAQAHAAGDANAYQMFREQSTNAAALAQQMHGEVQAATFAQQSAPLVHAEQQRNLQAAEQHLSTQTGGDYTARREQVVQVLRERPYLITGHSAQEIHRGLADAYTIAQAMPAPTTVEASIDEMAKAAIERHVAATRAAKAKAADDAVGASGERSAPGTSGGEPSTKDTIYAQQRSASQGARAFMDL